MRMRLKNRFLKKQDGFATIEYAILLPVVALLSVGGLDLGLYMLKHNAAERMLNVATNAIQSDINVTKIAITSQGTESLLDFPADGYLCARSYANVAQANQFAASCAAADWRLTVTPPTNDTYFVALRVFVNYRPIFLHGILPESFTKTAVVPINPGEQIPDCDGEGQFLQADGDEWICAEQEEQEVERRWYGSQGQLSASSNLPNAGCLSNSDHAVCPTGGKVVGADLCDVPPCPFSLCTAVLCEFPEDE